jgi:hypothetical protein
MKLQNNFAGICRVGSIEGWTFNFQASIAGVRALQGLLPGFQGPSSRIHQSEALLFFVVRRIGESIGVGVS